MTTRRAVLYARVSSDPQEGSLGSQLRELRDHAAREGLEVVEEVRDLAEKRHTLERPGVDRLRELAESGAIQEVWAWEWARYGSFPVPDVLAVELRDYGVELRSLDDGGGGEDGEDMQVIKSLFSRREQRDRVRRANRGRGDKAFRGEVFGGFRARFGLRFVKGTNKRGQEVSVGYEPDPDQMPVVRRVFEAIASGASLKAVRREFEQEGVPNPSGGPRWSTTTLRGIVQDDVFRPHVPEEIEAVLPPGAAAGLAPGREYGIHWSGRKRSRYKSSRGKTRIVYETPPEEWTAVAVDLTDSGLDRAIVDRARALVAENRATSAVGDRTWELKGALKCGECGRNMIAYRRARSAGGYLYYYRCRPSSTLDACSNRKSHDAYDLERYAVNMFENYADRGTLLELYDEAVVEEEKRLGLRGSRERRAPLQERLSELEQERKGYLRQNARGVLTDAELDAMLTEVDDLRKEITAQLRVVEEAVSSASRIQALRQSLLSAEWYEVPEAVQPGEYLSTTASQEEIRRAYARFGARFEVDREGDLTLRLEIPLDNGSALRLTTTC